MIDNRLKYINLTYHIMTNILVLRISVIYLEIFLVIGIRTMLAVYGLHLESACIFLIGELEGLFNNYVTSTCFYTKFRWLIYVQVSPPYSAD